MLSLLFLGLTRVSLRYAPAPADNPLKGLVPYQRPAGVFPQSMEFNYIALKDLVVGRQKYNWTKLESLLNDVASRGNQAIFRVYVEYPGRPSGIPVYLTELGLKVHKYKNTNTSPHPPQEVETPNYEDGELRACLKDFISELGKRYDGDPRIGFITAGLLGRWGEWHTYPREELWASKAVQEEVMAGYETAFKTTRILLRYPAGRSNPTNASTIGRRFGYHDDSFAWATLDTPTSRDWYFVPAQKAAGPLAVAAWKSNPIGGEIRPEAWGIVFDEKPKDGRVQDFRACMEATHASWLMDSGMFEQTQSSARVSRAKQAVQRMGYEFHVSAAEWGTESGRFNLAVTIENRGVAPFYYNWPVEFAVLGANREIVSSKKLTFPLVQLLPKLSTVWRTQLNLPNVAITGSTITGSAIAMRIKNPLATGKPVRFANETQTSDSEGWLILGKL